MKRISLLLILGLASLNGQDNSIDQSLNFIAPPTGGKFLEWYGKLGRSYFIQISDPSDHLNKWKWGPVIERGNDENISYEVDGTADKGFFRLQYTDQTATDLDTADFDGDGISNIEEITPDSTTGIQTNPLDPDTDHDGLPDKWERDHGLNPTDDGSIDPNNGPTGDLDGDGVSNIQEQADHTDPNNPDSDGDGLTDGEEKEIGSNPNCKNSDNDGLEDGEDADPTDPLVDWHRVPESSYVMIEIEDDGSHGDAKDLNNKGEVLFGGGIWAGGNWITRSHDAITGVYPGTVNEAYPNGIPYEVLNEQWDFFNNDRKLLQSALIHPTDGPGVDTSAPCPLFWPAAQSTPSLIYDTADHWDRPYWNALSLGVTTSGEMLIRATLQTSSNMELIERYDPSGALIGSMDGTGGYHPSGQWQHGDVTPSGWLASNLTREATSTQPVAHKLGLWDAANNLISLPAEADGWGYPVRLADLPNNKVVLMGGQWPNGIHQGRVFLPDANGDMQYDESMSDKHLQLMAGDGTGMTSDGKLWRNGKLIPLRDLSAKYKELEAGGYSLFPMKANKNGVYLIQAQNAQGTVKTFTAGPLQIVPDDNMAGVIGDMVKSINVASKITHFVSPKKTLELAQDQVILKTTAITAEMITPGNPKQLYEWNGGEAVPNEPLKRRVSRGTASKTEVKIKNKLDGTDAAQINIWIVWSDVTTSNGTPSFTTFLGGAIYEIGQLPTSKWRFIFKIQPESIFDATTLDRPSLSGYDPKPVPGATKPYTFNPSDGDGDSATTWWDVSRQYKVTIRNPEGILKIDLQQGGVPGAWTANQPIAVDSPVSFPASDFEGNDDPIIYRDEDTDPYKANTGNVGLNHQKGEISSNDVPKLRVLDGWGALNRSYSVELNFKEFARLEMWDRTRTSGQFWFRISDHVLWHHYLDTHFDTATSQWNDLHSSSGTGHPKP